MKKLYGIDCKFACCSIITDENDIIIKTAPIFKKFLNQDIKNLIKWLKNKECLINFELIDEYK